MGAPCGMVGWGQVTQDLVGHGGLWTFTSSKAVVRAPMLLHEEENHLQEVHDFGLGITVLYCSLWSHTVLIDVLRKGVTMLVGATSLSQDVVF